MDGRIDAHRHGVRVLAGDALVHLEEVAVALGHHVLAEAVVARYPGTKVTIGPAIATGIDPAGLAVRTLVNGLETANDAKAYEVGFAYSGGRMHLKTFKEVTHAAP